jgi:hypothetical protein
MNTSAATYVGWQWQAGQGSTSSNTSGTITSTVSVNATAGFSIVTFTATAGTQTVGHGLGVAPAMVIIKSRSNIDGWLIYHKALGVNNYIYLEQTGAATTFSGIWSAISSTVFPADANIVVSGRTYVAYCWAEIAGYSAFGSYTGNGSTDGPFVYTGFRPKFIIYKVSSGAGSWVILDTSRTTYNVTDKYLLTDAASAEGTFATIDILSNGFKVRNSDASNNPSGGTVIYMAFAESPFRNSLAR